MLSFIYYLFQVEVSEVHILSFIYGMANLTYTSLLYFQEHRNLYTETFACYFDVEKELESVSGCVNDNLHERIKFLWEWLRDRTRWRAVVFPRLA